jgi:hypothetical protein
MDALQPDARPRGAESVLRPRHPHEREHLRRQTPAPPLWIAWQQPRKAVIAVAIAPFAHGRPTQGKMARRRLEAMLLRIREDHQPLFHSEPGIESELRHRTLLYPHR